MSASEKLKALADEYPRGPAWVESYLERVHDALPQIVAVVEAAEQFGAEWWSSDYTDVAAALTALERVLDGE